MSIKERILSATMELLGGQNSRVGRAVGLLTNYYEAVWTQPNRSYVWGVVTDPRFDTTSFSRWELSRKIRAFRKNCWLIQKHCEIFTKYTVGPNGLTVSPATSDPEWNKRMSDAYAQWCQKPCRDSLSSMADVHKIMAEECKVDGEVFILKTRERANGVGQSQPRIQLIESHRVGGGYLGQPESNDIDGVIVSDSGRPIGYKIRANWDAVEPQTRDAKDVIHVWQPGRAGQYRAITPYHSVINLLTDLDDLMKFEMQRAKDNAQISNAITTKSGEIPDQLKLRQQALRVKSTLPTPPGSISENEMSARIEQYRKVLGARTIALKKDETLAQFGTENPSAATQWFWRMLIELLSESQGIPIILVMPDSIQGTVARAILDDTNLFMRSWYFTFAGVARELYLYFADWARYNIDGIKDPPADWKRCKVSPPRSPNVDVGRNSAAMLAELAAGATNLTAIGGAQGMTAEELVSLRADDVELVKRIAAERGLLPEEISNPLADVLLKVAQAAQTNTEPKEPINA